MPALGSRAKWRYSRNWRTGNFKQWSKRQNSEVRGTGNIKSITMHALRLSPTTTASVQLSRPDQPPTSSPSTSLAEVRSHNDRAGFH